jgi:hypothetical protein
MTELLYSPKIKPEHLARKAIVYLRALISSPAESDRVQTRFSVTTAGREQSRPATR